MLASLPRPAWWLFAAVVVLAWFSGIGVRKLQHPDEGRYAEIAREMAATGNWVTPRLNGLKYFEKPPFQYWATAATFKAFGESEWTARLVPALAGLLTVVIVGATASRLESPAVGAYAALVQAGSLLPFALSQLLTLDAVLTMWLTLALCAFLLAQRDGLPRTAQRNAMLVAFAAAAGATLTKGLVGFVIPGATLVLYSLVTRDAGPWKRLHVVPGLALFLLLTVPWFVAVSRVNPEFAQFFFIHEHVERFLTTEHRRTGGWYYFIPLLAAGILPWLGIWLWTIRASWRDAARAESGFAWAKFCLVWAAFVFVFFSASGSKLPSYILPLFPALSLVLGRQLTRTAPRTLAALTLPLAAVSALGWVVLVFGYDRLLAEFGDTGTPAAVFTAFGPWVTFAVGLLAASQIAAVVLLRCGGQAQRTLAIVALALGMLCALQAGFTGYDAFRATRSAYDLVESAQAANGGPLDPGAPVFQVRTYDQTLAYYLRRTTTLVAYRDELALGLDQEPDKGYADEAAWIVAWGKLPQGYAMLRPEDYDEMAVRSVPMRVLARDPRRVFVARR
jgi:4-amino-4-deoxy-L-arabinose transferase-like glycosyltransferase